MNTVLTAFENIDDALMTFNRRLSEIEDLEYSISANLDALAKLVLPDFCESTLQRLRELDPTVSARIWEYTKSRKFLGIVATTKYKRNLLLARRVFKEYIVDRATQEGKFSLTACQERKILLKESIRVVLDLKNEMLLTKQY